MSSSRLAAVRTAPPCDGGDGRRRAQHASRHHILVIYAVISQVPTGSMLIAGILPGLVSALAFAVYVSVRALPLTKRRHPPRCACEPHQAPRHSAVGSRPCRASFRRSYRRHYTGYFTPLPGMIEISESLLIVMTFLGLAHAERIGTHVRTVLVTDRFGAVHRKWARFAGYVFSLVIVAWWAVASMSRAVNRQLEGRSGLALLSSRCTRLA